MARTITTAADAALKATQGYAPVLFAELKFDARIAEDSANPGEPDAYIEWQVQPHGTFEAITMLVSLDAGLTWHNVWNEAVAGGKPVSEDKTTGKRRAPVPTLVVGDPVVAESILIRQVFDLPAGKFSELVYVDVSIKFDTGETVSRREQTLSDWDAGTLHGLVTRVRGSATVLTPVRRAAVRFTADASDHGKVTIHPVNTGTANKLWVSRGQEYDKVTARDLVGQPGTVKLVRNDPRLQDDPATRAFTVEFWVKKFAADSGGFAENPIFQWFGRGLVAADPTIVAGLSIGIYLVDEIGGPAVGVVANLSDVLDLPVGISMSPHAMATGQNLGDGRHNGWHHIALVYDGAGTATIYGNGTPVTGGPLLITDPAGAKLIIETRGDIILGGKVVDTEIDELRIWDVARTQTELLAIADAEIRDTQIAGLVADGLVGYWRMDESNGGLVKDLTGNGNHGKFTLPGVAWDLSDDNWIGTIEGQAGQSFRQSPPLQIQPTGNFVRVTTAPFDVTWTPETVALTFQGIGHFGGITNVVSETQSLESRSLEMVLSGLDQSNLDEAMTVPYLDRPARLWGGFFDMNGDLVADPVLLFAGRMDTMPITVGEQSVVRVICESRLIDWERPLTRRWNDTDQQQRFPGDRGFANIALMADKQIWWPAKIPPQEKAK